jgi:hypothetical protein
MVCNNASYGFIVCDYIPFIINPWLFHAFNKGGIHLINCKIIMLFCPANKAQIQVATVYSGSFK